jgi:hypothetical protein
MFKYEICCVDAPTGEMISEMKEGSREITYKTFRSHCEGVDAWARSKGYDRTSRQGLTLKADWAVGFYKGTYDGRPCFYLSWSGIEYIWTKDGAGGDEGFGYYTHRE